MAATAPPAELSDVNGRPHGVVGREQRPDELSRVQSGGRVPVVGRKWVPLRAHSASSGWISGNTGAMSTTTALPLILRGVWGADSAAGAVSVLHWVADVRVRVQLAISGGE